MTGPAPAADAPAGAGWVWLLASGGSALVLGLVIAIVGIGAFGALAGPTDAPAAFLLGTGEIALLIALAVGGRATPRRLARALPRLYPFGGPAAQFGAMVLAIVSAAAVISAIFAEYTGSLAGGDSAAVPDPAVLNGLYLLASGVLWIFALWVILLIAQVIRLGRAVERTGGRNVYGRVDPDEDPSPLPRIGRPAPPAAPDHRRAVLGSTMVIALAAMAAIQAVETGGDPPPVLLWGVLELLTPIWAVGVGFALLGIDRYVRELERRAASLGRSVGSEGPASPPVEGSPRFVL